MRTIRFRRLSTAAQLPTRGTAHSSGLDLCAVIPRGRIHIARGDRAAVATGLAVQIPEGHEGQVRPRSGMAFRDGVVAVLGTIDADYRGEIMVCLENRGERTVTIMEGQRIAQLVISPVDMLEPEEVDTLTETARGGNGLGSTGA